MKTSLELSVLTTKMLTLSCQSDRRGKLSKRDYQVAIAQVLATLAVAAAIRARA